MGGPPHALLVSRTPAEGMYLEEALTTQDISVETMSPAALPSSLEGLLAYDLVILIDTPPSELDQLRQAALASYVRDTGGGLLAISGRQGLRRDVDGKGRLLASVLPVDLAAPSEKEEPPVALVLLIDRSSSMIGEKLDYAKQAALAVIDKLTANDQLGVIAFDARYDWILPLAPLKDKAQVKATVGSLGAGGGTKFAPALEEAYYALGSSDSTIRHEILLTDGVSTDPDVFAELLGKLRAGGVTVSTVAIGSGADLKLLKDIARLGQGRFSLATRAEEVPNIFVKETQALQNNAQQHAETRALVATSARELAGIDWSTAPTLGGYVRTHAKATSETLLETSRHDPLLVRWRYGLGQVLAFTSDATTLWGTNWITSRWPGFSKLWAQTVRGMQRPHGRQDLALSLEIHDERLSIKVIGTDPQGRLLDELEVHARVVDGTSQTHELVLEQVGPGRYATTVEVPPGSVLVLPTATRAGRRYEGRWGTLSRPYPVELMHTEPNRAFLESLTTLGRGHAVTDVSDALGRSTIKLPRTIPLLPLLGLAAAVLFLIELSIKRARWERRT